MFNDPIVEEVRQSGARLAEKCGYDIHKYAKMIKENQDKSDKKIVTEKYLLRRKAKL